MYVIFRLLWKILLNLVLLFPKVFLQIDKLSAKNYLNTDKKVLIELAFEKVNLLSASYKNGSASSTIFSALKRLTEKGILIKTENYEIDDPFFKNWIVKRRSFH